MNSPGSHQGMRKSSTMMDRSFQRELELYGPGAVEPAATALAPSLRYCRQLARRHYENFTVGGLVVPSAARQHVANIYAYCRWADDLADEAPGGEALSLLDWWEGELDACYAGRTRHPVFTALGQTIRRFEIPREPFADLLAAFRQDQRVTRYATFQDLLGYCRCSANPVGRLVLHLAECYEPRRARLADCVCTGLQLANFCQDVSRDWQKGRFYLPLEDCRVFGVDVSALADGRTTEPMRRLLAFEVDRAERTLRDGLPLVGLLPRPWQLSVALFVHGGLAILEAIRRRDYDVLRERPVVGRLHKLRLIIGCWWRLRREPRREGE